MRFILVLIAMVKYQHLGIMILTMRGAIALTAVQEWMVIKMPTQFDCYEMSNTETIDWKMQEPPLGITPQYIWDFQRIDDILDGMERYSEVQKPIPVEWVCELKQLVKKMK